MGQIDEIQFKSVIIDETLKNFIYKTHQRFENCTKEQEKGKGQSNRTSCNPKLNVKISSCQKRITYNRLVVFLYVKNLPLAIGRPW
jgi:hypothetical protein